LTQRGINLKIIDIVYQRGKITDIEGGTMKIAYGKEEYDKDRSKLLLKLRRIEDALNRQIVVANSKVSTV